jgi:hypothetical protein
MICPSCNKFAGYDEPEAEVNDCSISSDGTISIEVRVLLKSACCSEELKEWNPILESEIDAEDHQGEGHKLEAECSDCECGDYYDNPGRPSRYRRHIYTVDASPKITCSCGKLEATVDIHEEERASGFDELV